MRTLTLYSVQSANPGVTVHTVAFQTRNPDVFKKALDLLKELQASIPKLARPGAVGAVCRPMVVGEITNRMAVVNARNAGALLKTVTPGTQYPSLKLLCEDLGLSAQSIRNLLGRARKANSGFDAPITIYGMQIRYAKPNDEKVSI